MNTITPKRKVSGRGSLRKRWDVSGRPWYMVCPCFPGRIYTLGPVGADMAAVMAEAAKQGWKYDPGIGWSCPECVRREIHAQLDKHTVAQGKISDALSKAKKQFEADEAAGRGDP